MKKILFALLRMLWGLFVAALLVFLMQDLLVFPGIVFSKAAVWRGSFVVPSGVEQLYAKTADNEQLDVWYLPAVDKLGDKKKVAIIFHGNGAGLPGFFILQQWFASIGISSYAFDYRGFGNSSGWPSNAGIREDARAIWRLVQEREDLEANEIIVFGISVGSGPAAWLAAEISPDILMLLAPYLSLKQVAADRPGLGLLSPLLWYEFSTIDYVAALRNTCLILAHGDQDTVIKPYHSVEIEKKYQTSREIFRIKDAQASHHDLFYRIKASLAQGIEHCSLP